MHEADRSVITTLAFAGALRWPLTLMDIHERTGSPVSDLLQRLDALVADGTVRQELGMYALVDTDGHLFRSRVEREKECAQKWRRMRRYAFWLQAVPCVRALMASGSLALGNTGPDSDWDIFVIARTGRLYTARAFLLAAARALNRLRTKRDSLAPDKFCFNHYVTDDALDIRHRSRYVAWSLASLVPVHDPEDLLAHVRESNPWMSEYTAGNGGEAWVRRTVASSRLLGVVRRTLEFVLAGRAGDWLERRLMRWQQGRIQREPATHERGGRVTADEREIEFHPRSAEAAILEAYNHTLARHGLAAYAERDSGLTS